MRAMKKLIFIIIALIMFIIPDAYGQKGENRTERLKVDTLKLVNDSLEYELIITDPGFEGWLVGKPSINYRSDTYYRSKNNLYVIEWNSRFLNPLKYGLIYENYIDYDPRIDYGIELNYKLYYYFRYFEEKNRVVLVPSVK